MKSFSLLLLFVLFATSSVTFTACKHGEDDPEVTINLLEPTEGATFAVGETVNVRADITSTEEMHGYEVEIRRMDNNSVLFATDAHGHGTEMTVDETWVNTLTGGEQHIIVEVRAIINHQGETVSESVTCVSHN